MFDTIVAISSGMINQPISIIRLSGEEAYSVVKKFFSGKIGKHREITYGYIFDDKKNRIDEVLVSWFKGPETFTGEDVVEINAHGGMVNSQKILQLALTNGARQAERGEFSRQAFLNNKMSLIKAEAIHDLIFAKTDAQAKLAANKFDNKTSVYINELITKLLNIIATIETNIDYPEYDDVEQLTAKVLKPQLQNLYQEISTTIKLAQDANFITSGIKVAIIGRPNVGKSTLLNALLNKDKAIVTNIPGTTRDVVEGEIVIDGIYLKLFDTAGIRKTNNPIEKEGIIKSKAHIEQADIIFHVIDAQVGITEDDKELMLQNEKKFSLLIFNKSDLQMRQNRKDIYISAKNKEINALINTMKRFIPHVDLNNYKLITNARQQSLIIKASENINQALKAIEKGFKPDEFIVDLRSAWENLTNIVGRADNEQLLDQMFKNFCLGK